MKKIVFMGTPDFAVPILEALINQEDYQIVGVVTQPDRPVGRKRRLEPTPVKEVALAHDLPVYQPEVIGKDKEVADLLAEDIDLIITAAYGQFLPERLLQLPTYGAINVHASLLPKYRGGAPVHYALWNGDQKTGVTIMRMVKEMDAGDIIAVREFPISTEAIVEELFADLSQLGRDLLIDTLPEFFAGTIEEIPQDHHLAIVSPNITREQEQIDWTQSATQIHNHIRAMNSWPVAHTFMNGDRWKLWRSQVMDATTDKAPGTVITIQKKPAQFQVACGEGTVLALTELQPAGKKAMDVASFINGGSGGVHVGDQFSNQAAK